MKDHDACGTVCSTANETHNRGKKVVQVSLPVEHTVHVRKTIALISCLIQDIVFYPTFQDFFPSLPVYYRP